jgi:FkbM family methyltransferase
VAPSLEHRDVLRELDCDLLLDVGADRGQFSLMARLLHPGWRIRAYEPQPSGAAVFRAVFLGHAGIELHEVALGEVKRTAQFHVSRRADSSSLLPIGELQSHLFPGTEERGTINVEVVPLDSVEAHWMSASRALLKLDVQGYELNVLRGAQYALRHCAFVYAECSEIALYAGQALYPEVAAFLDQEGFKAIRRANEQWAEGRLVQADYLFARA